MWLPLAIGFVGGYLLGRRSHEDVHVAGDEFAGIFFPTFRGARGAARMSPASQTPNPWGGPGRGTMNPPFTFGQHGQSTPNPPFPAHGTTSYYPPY
jgi:hypothetical protein